MSLALDNFAFNNSGGASSLGATLSTVNAGDIICALITTNGGPVTGVASTSGLTWHFGRSSQTLGAAFPIELWWAYAPSAVTSEVVTASSTSSSFITIDVFGVSSTVGFNSTNPFDSTPAVSPSSNVDVLLTVAATNSFIVFAYRLSTDASSTAGSGFTLIHSANFQFLEYVVASSSQSNLDGTHNAFGGQNGGIGFALVESAGGGVSVSLTGQGTTVGQGSLAKTANKSISGQSSTLGQGSITPTVAKSLTGQSITASQGSLAFSVILALTGQSMTASIGAVTTSNGTGGVNVTYEISRAYESTAFEPTAFYNNEPMLMGVLQGALGITGGVGISGQSATVSQGSLSKTVNTSLTGQPMTLGQGSISRTVALALTGQGLTANIGAVSFLVSLQLTGQLLTIGQGQFGSHTLPNHNYGYMIVPYEPRYMEVPGEPQRNMTVQDDGNVFYVL